MLIQTPSCIQPNTQTRPQPLKEQLQEAEKSGLIQKKQVNQDDKAALQWTSQQSEKNQLKSTPIINKLLKQKMINPPPKLCRHHSLVFWCKEKHNNDKILS